MDIKKLTEEHLFEIANIATGGYFKSQWSKSHKEVEVGGYGKRRRVVWIQNTEGYDEYHAFELTAEHGARNWSSEVSLKESDWDKESYWVIDSKDSYKVNCVNPSGVIDYCDNNGIDVRNNGA